jgi:hypothetical protein
MNAKIHISESNFNIQLMDFRLMASAKKDNPPMIIRPNKTCNAIVSWSALYIKKKIKIGRAHV